MRRPMAPGLGLDHRAAAEQDRLGDALVQHGLHRAQHPLVLAFGIDDARGRGLRPASNTGRIRWPER